MGGEAPVVAATGMSSVVTALTGEGGISATTYFTVIKEFNAFGCYINTNIIRTILFT